MRTAWPQGVPLPIAHLSAPQSRPRLSRSKNDSSSPGTSDQRPVLAKPRFRRRWPNATVRVADFVHSSAADSNSSRNLCVARKCWLSSSVLTPRAMTPQVATRLRVHDDDAALRARPRRRRLAPAGRDPAGPFPSCLCTPMSTRRPRSCGERACSVACSASRSVLAAALALVVVLSGVRTRKGWATSFSPRCPWCSSSSRLQGSTTVTSCWSCRRHWTRRRSCFSSQACPR